MSTGTPAGPLVARLPVVSVIGSGVEAHEALAAPVGALVARLGAHLLTGAGSGVMEAAARGFCAVAGRSGLSIGIVPAGRGDAYPNAWIELPIQTHLRKSGVEGTDLESRNHIVALSATAIVALPGGAGTESEIALALRYGRPIVAYGRDAPGVVRAGDLGAVEGFLRERLG